MPRPKPGTHEEGIYQWLIPQMSRAGRQVDLEACAALATVIQAEGHRSPEARRMAQEMGLDPRYLPRRRTW